MPLSPTTIQHALAAIEQERAQYAGIQKTYARQLRAAEDEVERARTASTTAASSRRP